MDTLLPWLDPPAPIEHGEDTPAHVTELVAAPDETPAVVTSETAEKLPQTGLLLWVVELIAGAGAALVAAGVVRHRRVRQ
jgi:hypothetical protein